MAFFGVELKAAKPYSHRFDATRGRLHISHATLGIGTSTKKCFVQCNVGNKSPILLCALTPGQSESCSLDLEFEEEEEVIFSVIGPSSVYLTGYYLGNSCSHGGDGDESDSYGEDIAETDSGESSYYDSEEDEYEDDFIDDDDDDDDLEMYSGSPKKSGVVIEEIIDEKPVSENGDRKRLKKKYVSDSDGDNQKQLVVRGSDGLHLPESEDEDGLPIHSNLKSKSDKKASKKKAAGGSDQVTGSKRKMDAATQDGEPEKETDQPKDTVEIEHESSEKPKKKKRKERAKEAKDAGAGDDTKIDVPKQNSSQTEEATATDNPEQIQAVRDEQDEKLSNGKMLDVDSDHKHDDAELKTKKKKKKKAKKISDDTEDAKKDSIVENKEKNEELKPSQARTFSNGLVVEELQMGKPDGKRASAGSKVFVNYIGKLKKNGAIFDSNVGRAPFKFRLGIGEVIKGWDVGVNGMRIGDKRRITIPPSMGYGAKGAGGKIPPHAWLVFDVELVDVR